MLKVTTHPIANIELHLLHGGNTILDIEKLVMASTAWWALYPLMHKVFGNMASFRRF